VTPPPARSAPGESGRAGRNLPAAIGVGVGLGALVLGTLYTVKAAFVAVVVVAIGVAVGELARGLATRDVHVPIPPVLVGGSLLLVAAYVSGTEAMTLALLLTTVAVLGWRLPGPPVGYLRDVSAGVFTALYVPFLAGFCLLLLAPPDGAQRVTVFMVMTVASDVGGYAAGVLCGRHPLAPTVSPKKSWEGLVGSVLACLLVGAAAVPVLLHGAVWHGLILGLAVVASATLGDLGESMVKRDLGVKDMGALLPGHGGLMDRLDSLLPTAPVAWALLTLFDRPG
jgi:phosphatidate cytidylyltransferase